MNFKKKLFLVSSSVILSACGGGNDSNQDDVIDQKFSFTPENYVTVAKEAITSSPHTDYHGFAIAEANGMQAITLLGIGELREIIERTPESFPRFITNENCPLGGSVVYKDYDNNSNLLIDAGDVIEIDYQQCNARHNGVFVIDILSKGKVPSPQNISASITYKNYTTKSVKNRNTVGSGTLTFEMDYLSYRTINTKIKADTFTIQTITPTITSNQILKDYQAFANIRDPSFMSSVQSTVISSRLDNKSIEIKTLAQINPFADGLMTISGANQAIIRIKTIGTTSAVIELDENGDGTYEATQTLTWDSFINP